jgi:RNA recognition motif-containing protein
MKKKTILFIAVPLIILALLYFKYIFGWMEFRWNRDTPDKFLSHVVIEKEKYSKDKAEILNELRYFLKDHAQSFESKVYYDSTKLSLDTILYGPDFNKLSVFVIAKNPTSRMLAPNERYDYYYDGFCYLGIRQNDSIVLISIDEGFGKYSQKKTSETLRTNYFRLYATIKDVNGEYRYKYNMNDIRFWTCPVWKEVADIREQARNLKK